MSNTITPLGDRVLVKRRKPKEQTEGGIILPESAQEQSQEAEVIALGTGSTNEEGQKKAFSVKVNDVVLISKYGGTEIKLNGEDHVLLKEEDILGIIS